MRAKEIIMKKLNLTLAVLAVGAALSGAQMASAQGLTRAEVKAQLAQAQADGSLNALNNADSGSFYLSKQFHSTEPRSEVKAELAAAEANGTLDVQTGEDSGSTYLTEQFHSTEPRSEVKAEVKQAEADGSLNALDGEDSGSFYLARHQATRSGNNAVASR
ncbi:DUF4148 domain-containing protein [Variovorax sp. J22R133]|uniref:DUF4148 domain-containing protein n=1 Tax=Variovorax brevis TaxID=3053503 RepID=UPI002574B0E3|nr:DUF4148 domain-containing protein [Variovorax sp. J22R133]MDM0113641.1 DUF4148 domain-containing protein [Variovorax sp. J22R133]